ncbi:HEXXH motif domain-containing protein [Nonomuraea sp. NPDC050786]|uniref:HEXXH motif domain-containing protein n=1 Tax=Nonomuraea sp. NPDC050786 TaxID=3154840 RepID=UPI00340864C5
MTGAGPALEYHDLSWVDIDAMAVNGGDRRIARQFGESERSRVLLLLRAILRQAGEARDATGPLPPLGDAWDTLARAQQAAPAALDAVLDHPFTGAWAAHTIRRLRGGRPGPFPLWAQLGHLHALAAAAAVRAGIGARLRCPVTAGRAVLPTLGAAELGGDDGTAWCDVEVEAGQAGISGDGRRVLMPADPARRAGGWRGLRRFHLRSEGLELTLCLDDLDPYRGLAEPLPPEPLGEDDERAWGALLGSAWDLVCRAVPGIAAVMPYGLTTIVPRPPAGAFREVNASSADAFRSAAIGRPRDAATLGSILVHEFQHIELGALLHLVRMHDDAGTPRFYAPWRDDPRPLGGMLQGVYAFAGVASYWHGLAERSDGRLRRRAEFEFARWHPAVLGALREIRTDTALTGTGTRFLDGVERRLRQWDGDRIPPETAAPAELARLEHHLVWRVRHVRPDPAAVDSLARSWLKGVPPETAEITAGLSPDGGGTAAREVGDLLRLRAMDGEIPAAPQAGHALAAGDHQRAFAAYAAELVDSPSRASAWAGFALAARAARPGGAAELLCSRPELVHALHAAIRATGAAPDPWEVAAWLVRTGL